MTIYAYAKFEAPDRYDLFAFHREPIDRRAQELVDAGTSRNFDMARVDAETEARVVALREVDWPEDWMDDDRYSRAMITLPLPELLRENAASVRWEDGMPAPFDMPVGDTDSGDDTGDDTETVQLPAPETPTEG